jgi:hypothetical protein
MAMQIMIMSHLPAGDRRVGRGADDECVRHHGDKAVDVRAHVDLDHVAVGEHDIGLGDERREVADAVVDRDAGREGDSFDQLLVLLEGLASLLQEAGVALDAHVPDRAARLACFAGLLQHFCGREGGRLKQELI